MKYLAIALLLTACDDSESPDSDTTTADVTDQDGAPETSLGDGIITESAFTKEDLGAGVTRGVVDATRETGWVQLKLADGSQVTTEDGWDMAFQRILIRVNHPLAVLNLPFEEVTQAPADGYVEDGDNPDAYAFSQLGEWWSYNLQNHTVTPKAHTFILKMDEETYYKIAVRDYYDDAGTTGFVTLDWASVAKP